LNRARPESCIRVRTSYHVSEKAKNRGEKELFVRMEDFQTAENASSKAFHPFFEVNLFKFERYLAKR
jgi:hypothetical protein